MHFLFRFMVVIYEELSQPVIDKINRATFFSILVDGSTDTSVREMEVVYVMFVDPDDGYTKVVFLTIEEVRHANAPGVLEAITTGKLNMYIQLHL